MGERLSFASGYMEGTHAGRGAADCGAVKNSALRYKTQTYDLGGLPPRSFYHQCSEAGMYDSGSSATISNPGTASP